MSKKAIWVAIGLILLIAWSCKGKSTWKGTVETVNGVQVVHNPKTPMYPQGALELQEDLSIGAAEGAEEYMFIQLRGLAVDDEGSIYALDQRKPRVDVFSSSGVHLRSIGRRGQGPGEFQVPFFVSLAPHEELLVGEMSRLSYFDRSGAFLRSQENSVKPFAFVKFLANGDAVGTRMVIDEKDSRYEVVLCGPELESRSVMAYSRMPDPGPKFNLFASVVRWDIPGGTEVVCGAADEGYRLDVFDGAGRPVRRIFKDYDPVPPSGDQIDRQMKQHGVQSREEVTIPRYLPPISWVYADEVGRIYVSTWQRDPETGVALFNIFDPQGRYLCDYRIPGEPIVFKAGKLYATIKDADGIQYIKRYHMTWNN